MEREEYARKKKRKKERNRRKGEKGTGRYTYDIHACSSQIRRVVAASSAARATINSPLLLSAPLLGSHCVYVVSSLLFASRCFSQWRIVWDLSVLPTSPCFIERSRSLSLRPFCFSRLRRRRAPTFESCVFNFDLGVTRSREVQCVLQCCQV